MKKILFVFSLTAILSSVYSQNKTDSLGWHKDGFAGLNLNQLSLTNWAEGGESSLSATSLFNYVLKFKGRKTYWDNNLNLAYGLIKTEDEDVRKNEDLIDFTSKYGRYAFGKFYYAGLLNFHTQFAPGYNYPNDTDVVSRFMAPGYLSVSLGLDWRPVDYFSLYFSPAAGKFTFVLDQDLANVGAFGVDSAVRNSNGQITEEGKTVKFEFGATLVATFRKEILKNVELASKLTLFDDYTSKDPSNRKNVDVDWQTGFLMKVNDWITASILAHLIYDHNIPVPIYEKINGVKTQVGKGPRTQFKEALAIGISYKF